MTPYLEKLSGTLAAEEKRSKGRPMETWRTVEGVRQKMGFATLN